MDPTSVGKPRVDKRHRIVQTCNLTYCTTVTFVTIAAASLSAQRPLPAVLPSDPCQIWGVEGPATGRPHEEH